MTTIRWSRAGNGSTNNLLLNADGAKLVTNQQTHHWSLEELAADEGHAAILGDMGLDILAQALALSKNLDAIDAIDTSKPPSRPHHQRIYGGGRGGSWTVWFFGHHARFSARELGEISEMSLEELVEDGLPEGLEEICGAEVAAKILRAASELAPLECMCGTGCETPDQHGDAHRLSYARDPRAPYDVTAAVVRCEVCARWWTFEERGDSHYGYQRSLNQFIPTIDETD